MHLSTKQFYFISFILEFLLLYSLENAAKNEAYVEESLTQEFKELDLRKNIYDGDEFDVFKSEEINYSKIQFGKR